MNHCSSCKHFSEALVINNMETDFEDVTSRFHECRRVLEHNPYKQAVDLFRSEEPVLLAFNTGPKLSLLVTDSFGCVLWEPREGQ